MIAKFHRTCPNCGGIISDERLNLGLPCRKCLEKGISYSRKRDICNALNERLKGFEKLCKLEEFSDSYSRFFKERTGFTPWNLQLAWARRVALKRSFTMIAPTGVGKTTWGLVTSAYLSGKIYILVPTRLLVLQTAERLKKLTEKRILAYTGKRSEKEAIQSGNFEILITTTNFLYRNFEIIPLPFDFVFVDDVDSLLKSARNVDKVIRLLGFTEEDLERATEVLNLKSLAARTGNRADRKLVERIREIEKYLEERRKEVKGVLVVSSATSQPRSRRVKLFRELLGFEVGKSATALRNVEDILIYNGGDYLSECVDLIKRYGRGVFVFVSEDRGKDFVEKTVNHLKSSGIRAVSYKDFTPDIQEAFAKGEIDAVVGISSYRNPLARGIDLPEAVRYAVFIGVPKMEFSVKLTLQPVKLFGLLLALRELFEEQARAISYINYLKRYLTLKEELLDRYPRVKERLEEIKGFLELHLQNKEFLERVRSSDTVSLKEENGELSVVVGDAAGYIQASGRTSRMFAGGLTKGVSLMLVDDLKALNSLRRRIFVFLEGITFRVFKGYRGKELCRRLGFECITEDEIDEIFKRVDADRKRVKEVVEGKVREETKSLLKTDLVVVESPNKARTISSFFGKPTRRKVKGVDVYEINLGERLLLLTASKGYLFDLTVRDGIWGVVEEENRFIPVYDTIKYCSKCGEQTTEPYCSRCEGKPDIDKITIVEALREVGLEVDEVFIASDPDTEGEKIGWDTALMLKPYQPRIRRMEFHEVTKRAFLEALDKPRNIDENLVKAQIVRRIADRWVGFALSQHLWRVFRKRWLSAGRVQTPVLGWVIERHRESRRKIGVLTVKTEAGTFSFRVKDPDLFKRLTPDKLKVEVVKRELSEKNPPPPFNTGELLREASNSLNISAKRLMEISQELFESGFITYHRTDSTRVSTAGMGVAKEYITEHFGSDYVKLRSWGKGGAHECIRPTKPLDVNSLKTLITVSGLGIRFRSEHFRVYDLIFRRFMASQMVPLAVEEVKLTLKLIPEGIEMEEKIPVNITKDGWNLMLPFEVRELKIKPEEGETHYFNVISYSKRKVSEVFPFTQGELVQMMRERGIGRPSTYAKIVQTLLDRRYIIERGKFLYPTSLGEKIHRYLSGKFPAYTSEEFTKELEALMDRVESGEVEYQEIIGSLKSVLDAVRR